MTSTINNNNHDINIKQISQSQVIINEHQEDNQRKSKFYIRLLSSPLLKVYLLFTFIVTLKILLILNFLFTRQSIFIDPSKILIDPFVICKSNIEKTLLDDSQVKTCFDNVNYLKENCLVYVYEYKSCQFEMRMCKNIEEDLKICNIYNINIEMVKYTHDEDRNNEN